MKALIVTILIGLSGFLQPRPSDFSNFINFVTKTHRIPTAIKTNCNWQYAVVKLTINNDNKIADYEVLNETSQELKNSFNFLKDYKFGSDMNLRKQSVVFFYTIENTNDDCKGPINLISPTNAVDKWMAIINQEYQRNPQTVFIYKPIIEVIYPTSK